MRSKNIALIGYAGDYFEPFSAALEKKGFCVHWVCSNRSDAAYLTKKSSLPVHRVLDVNASFSPRKVDINTCRLNLAELETSDGPRINDIILMDRMLRRKKTLFAFQYMEHIREEMVHFFKNNQISLITSGRDSALQLISMLVGRKLQIPWVVPTRLRIPLETYGFCTNHETDTFLQVRERREEDRIWAEDVLEKFHNTYQAPVLKIAARNLKDTLRLMKPHFLQFIELLKRSYIDRGNDYSRYAIPRIIQMYLRRRINMFVFNLIRPWSPPGSNPFCIYALHTQPESSIDVAGSFFSDQIPLIAFIARSIPASHELYVKVHPTDVDGKALSFYRKIQGIPSVRLIHDDVDSRTLVAKASIIFTLTGTIGYEGGLMGKPVITFAKNFYNTLPTVHYCDSPPELPGLVDNLLNSVPPDDLRERVVGFLMDYRTRVFDGEVNRMFGENPGKLLKKDLETLQDVYDTLFQIMVTPNNTVKVYGQSMARASL